MKGRRGGRPPRAWPEGLAVAAIVPHLYERERRGGIVSGGAGAAINIGSRGGERAGARERSNNPPAPPEGDSWLRSRAAAAATARWARRRPHCTAGCARASAPCLASRTPGTGLAAAAAAAAPERSRAGAVAAAAATGRPGPPPSRPGSSRRARRSVETRRCAHRTEGQRSLETLLRRRPNVFGRARVAL